MTKQEEIREDTARTFYEQSDIATMIGWLDLPQGVKDSFFQRADNYLYRLDSQHRVVIKVERAKSPDDLVAVEPLIGGK